MVVNILYRQFKLNITNINWIDISPDVHVVRVFQRTGLIRENCTKEEIIWRARELYSAYPGVFDIAAFKLGREICHKNNPSCKICPLIEACPIGIINKY